ncbi:MAG: HAMP domain-containing histidine kinase [Actinomycetia bacterium]|nr:HAMP domain-containing histidine kinase [Actinomycetes bacterium]
MRRRLILLSAAVTAMVVIAFLVPLFILVSDLARDRAISTAQRDAESLARVLSVLSVEEDIATAIEILGEGRILEVRGSVVLPAGSIVGADVSEDEDLSLALEGSSFIAPVDGGQAFYIPVFESDGSVAVIRVFIPDEELTAGVRQSWLVLSLLGAMLVVIAAWVADLLGRSMVVPVKQLSITARTLGHGDMTARVVPAGPNEIEEVGLEINRLADRIGRLLQAERESAADLAHRLRTPLTAARLSIDGLTPGPQKERLIADLDELQRTTDFIIREARRPVRADADQSCDVAKIVAERSAFWLPLIQEQEREADIRIDDSRAIVAMASDDAEAIVDALVENVLSHTPEGAPMAVSVENGQRVVRISVEDAGPGFIDASAMGRGISSGDSTGLGLDIVRRAVESADGSMTIGESPSLGGASVVLKLPMVPT